MGRLTALLTLALAGWSCALGADPCPEGADGRGRTPPFGRAAWCETPEGELHGRQMLWYRHGHLLASAEFQHGRLDGRLRLQDRFGWRLRELHLRNGELHGRFVRWQPGNRKVLEGRYRDGRREDTWTTWHEDGTLRSEAGYRNDRLHGPYRRWSESGVLRVEGEYLHGRPVGRWIWRDDAGDVRKTIEYRWSAVVERHGEDGSVTRETLVGAEAIRRAEEDGMSPEPAGGADRDDHEEARNGDPDGATR